MKKRRVFSHQIIFVLVIACSAGVVGSGHALEYDFSGQVSGWVNISENDGAAEHNEGARYIPQAGFKQVISDDVFFDVQLAANAVASLSTGEPTDDIDLDLYRLEIRLATNQMETRLGLQKISFGPAFLLRSLQWFDRIDPRDPLKLTDGVYGVRFKYSALNNGEYWIWLLIGNDDLKGFEILPTTGRKPESGGRIQYPVPYGELGATFHTRQMDLSPFPLSDITERRFALDGRWDYVVGFWWEAVLQEYETDILPFKWVKLTTVGMDYTFGMGNGIHVLGEHMVATLSRDISRYADNRHISAYLVGYPIGFFDAVSVIGYYDWDSNKLGQYASWERTFDNLVISMSLFKYPQTDETVFGFGQPSGGKGSGGQVVFIYNH